MRNANFFLVPREESKTEENPKYNSDSNSDSDSDYNFMIWSKDHHCQRGGAELCRVSWRIWSRKNTSCVLV